MKEQISPWTGYYIDLARILRREPNDAPRSEIIEIVIGFSPFNPAFFMPGIFLVVKFVGDELQK